MQGRAHVTDYRDSPRIQGDDKAGSWTQAGHDAVYTTHTSRSSNPEWCVHPQRGVVTGKCSSLCTVTQLQPHPCCQSSYEQKIVGTKLCTLSLCHAYSVDSYLIVRHDYHALKS